MPKPKVIKVKPGKHIGKAIIFWQEIIAILALVALGIIWAFWIIPELQNNWSSWFQSLNPIAQYFIYNLGFMALTIGLFGTAFSLSKMGRIHWTRLLFSGLGTWFLFSFVLDLWQPPLFLNPDGSILIQNAQALTYAADDAMLAWIYTSWGISGPFLFYMVYLISPLIIGAISIVLIHPDWLYKGLGIQ